MVELQAAERRELPGVIPELPTEFPYPRIGSSNFGVVVGFGREQLAEHWDVIQDEVTKEASVSGLPMFGDKFPG